MIIIVINIRLYYYNHKIIIIVSSIIASVMPWPCLEKIILPQKTQIQAISKTGFCF